MNHKLMLTAVSAFSLGLAVQGLHAQMTPPAYVVAMNNIKDEAGYKNEFITTRAESHRRPRRDDRVRGFDRHHDTERRTAAERTAS